MTVILFLLTLLIFQGSAFTVSTTVQCNTAQDRVQKSSAYAA